MALTDTKDKDTGVNLSKHLKRAVNVRRPGESHVRRGRVSTTLHISQ